MIFALIVIVTAHLLAVSQTFTAMVHRDKEGLPVGLHVLGIPFEAVLAVTLLPLGYFVFTEDRQMITEAIGLGAAAVYANTWGRAVAFVMAQRRAARDGADPADPVDD